MLISEVMTPDVQCVPPTMPALEARHLMREERIHEPTRARPFTTVWDIAIARTATAYGRRSRGEGGRRAA